MITRGSLVAIVVLLVGAAFVGALLAHDGAFSRQVVLSHPLLYGSRQMSDFGPPTRLDLNTDLSGVVRRKVVAEPVYVDVRVPSFFDVIDVRMVLREAQTVEDDIRIGFELGRESGKYVLGETQVIAEPALGGKMRSTIVSTLSLTGIPHENNQFRLVLSLPGVDPEHPVLLQEFTVTARRSGDWRALVRRFIPRLQPSL